MARFVALLRGINVGPSSQIKMAELAAVFVNLGFSETSTLLRSGNVVFTGSAQPDADALEAAIASATGVKARTLVLTAARFRSVVEAWPFETIADDPAKSIITFVEEMPAASGLQRLTDDELGAEKLILGTHAVYQWIPDGVLATKLPAKFARQFGERATARNLRTARKLLTLLD